MLYGSITTRRKYKRTSSIDCRERRSLAHSLHLTQYTSRMLLIILIDCRIALKEVPLPRARKHNVHCRPPVRVDRGSNAIPVHPITAGSGKLPNWLIREAEETLENNIRTHKKGNRKRGSRQG